LFFYEDQFFRQGFLLLFLTALAYELCGFLVWEASTSFHKFLCGSFRTFTRETRYNTTAFSKFSEWDHEFMERSTSTDYIMENDRIQHVFPLTTLILVLFWKNLESIKRVDKIRIRNIIQRVNWKIL